MLRLSKTKQQVDSVNHLDLMNIKLFIFIGCNEYQNKSMSIDRFVWLAMYDEYQNQVMLRAYVFALARVHLDLCLPVCFVSNHLLIYFVRVHLDIMISKWFWCMSVCMAIMNVDINLFYVHKSKISFFPYFNQTNDKFIFVLTPFPSSIEHNI